MSNYTRGPFRLQLNDRQDSYWLKPDDKRSGVAVATVWIRGYGPVVGLANALLFAQAYRLPDILERIIAVKSLEDLELVKAEAQGVLDALEAEGTT